MTNKDNFIFKINSLINLTRINRPTGIWLLFLPALFSLILSFKSNFDLKYYELYKIIFWFFIGSVLVRTAGCIINDIFDQNFDKKVARTKSRPIANKEIGLYPALGVLTVLLSIGLFILLKFNWLTIILGFIAFVLIMLYPLAKRFTNHPQLFLGITFNFGVLMASSAINNKITLPVILLYISTILWTLVYDTVYAYQDIEDDMKIGVKSSAISFGQNPQKILYFLSILQILFLVFVGLTAQLKMTYYFLIYIALFYLLCLIKTCDFKDPGDCLFKFKSHSFAGLVILMAFLLG